MQTFNSLRRTARSLGLVTVGVLSTLGALSLTHVGPAQAQSPGVNLAQLVAQVNTLKAQVATLQAKTAPLSLSSDPNVGGTNTLLTIKGVNVEIENGMNSTETQNGLGNLILGYNENTNSNQRTGSHNIVAGPFNSYTSSAGMVVGYKNTSSNLEAVALGEYNTASGISATVSGGQSNTASNEAAAVSGGAFNIASGEFSSVSGGESNTASRELSSVSGGESNMAAGGAATVSGGTSVTQSTDYGWSGGSYHTP